MKIAFCTCVTADYLGFAQATFRSLQETYDGNASYISLVVDDHNDKSKYETFEILDLAEIDIESYGEELVRVKEMDRSSRFRWMLKPILLQHLLKKYDAVFWVDPDLYFFNDISSIVQKLKSFDVILSPHWRSFDPFVNQNAFFNYFYHGLFNGGFIGVSKNAIDVLKGWLKMMYWKLENSREFGILDDQGYLGVLPLLTEKCHIIRDRGCNVAAWNKQECKRTLVNGRVLINGVHTVKFIHFVPDTIKNILNGKDKFLRPHLRKYLDQMLEIEPDMSKLRSFDVDHIKRKTRGSKKAYFTTCL